MKQPELGKKISELRKVKGLTQEELVDKCNISVRTLQRIESGEVTPRSYTVKTILAALDYDLSRISDDDDKKKFNFFEWMKEILLIDINEDKPAEWLIRQLNTAWLGGLIYFILGFLEAAAEYYRMQEDEMIFSTPFYTIMKVAVFVSFVFFQRGFIIAGHLFKNYMLKIASFILIFGMLLVIGYDIATVFYESTEREFILGAEALTFGGIGILFGVSLIKLQRPFGQLPFIAGIFELFAACFFLTIIFSFIGEIILIPAELLEIVFLYKTVELVKAKQPGFETVASL